MYGTGSNVFMNTRGNMGGFDRSMMLRQRGMQMPLAATRGSPTSVTVMRRFHLERLVDNLYDILEKDAQAVEYRRSKQALGRQKLYRDAMLLKRRWAKLQADKHKLEVEKQCFEAACQAAWTSEHSGAEPLPLPGARAEAGETAVDGGAGEEESKGEQKLEGLSDLTRSRMNENDKRIRLNVGGQLFETTAEVLRREPDSLLAALTFSEPPAEADESGVFFFDRDWWLFRHVLHFLREGGAVLPSSRSVLRALFKEAAFWRLPSLRLALRHKYKLADDVGIAKDAMMLGKMVAPVDPLVTQSAFDSRLRPHTAPLVGGVGMGGVGAGGVGAGAWGGNNTYGGGYGAGYNAAGTMVGAGRFGPSMAMTMAGAPGGYGAQPGYGYGAGGRPVGVMAGAGSLPMPLGGVGVGALNGVGMAGVGRSSLAGAGGVYGAAGGGGYGAGAAGMGPGGYGKQVAPYENQLDPGLVAFEKSFGTGPAARVGAL